MPTDDDPEGEGLAEDPYHERYDEARDTRFPNLREKLVTVPCLKCNILVDVMALNHAEPQVVALTNHADPAGQHCTASGSEYLIPGRVDTGGFAYSRTGVPEAVDPAQQKDHPPAIESDRPLLDRLRDYALACPMTSLLKLHSEVEEACDKFYNIIDIFVSDRALDEPTQAAIEKHREVIADALTQRLRASASRGLHVEGEEITINDIATNEFVIFPVSSIRVRSYRSTVIRPKGADPFPGEEDEASEEDEN